MAERIFSNRCRCISWVLDQLIGSPGASKTQWSEITELTNHQVWVLINLITLIGWRPYPVHMPHPIMVSFGNLVHSTGCCWRSASRNIWLPYGYPLVLINIQVAHAPITFPRPNLTHPLRSIRPFFHAPSSTKWLHLQGWVMLFTIHGHPWWCLKHSEAYMSEVITSLADLNPTNGCSSEMDKCTLHLKAGLLEFQSQMRFHNHPEIRLRYSNL